MLTGVHFLLTYTCTFECDHCFLHCGPHSEGTFTRSQLRSAFEQIADVSSITGVYFEGGEPFLFYPLMLEGVRMARAMGLDVGIVTNAYWATSVEDARMWLEPLHALGISDLSLSDDAFHGGEAENTPAKLAYSAARELGMPADTICIEGTQVQMDIEKGAPVIGGGVRFKGRAAEKLTEGLPARPSRELDSCPHEDLENPGRVHIDAFGNVMMCQGLNIGNMWHQPLVQLLDQYDPHSHPIAGPLLAGGPVLLAERNGLFVNDNYVDECHLCYGIRKQLLDRYPEHLGPKQVYGL